MNIKVKKLLPDADLPTRGSEEAAGYDLKAMYSGEYFSSNGQGVVSYGTGLAVQIPPGYAGLLFPRSSILLKDLALANGVGLIDSDFRGELKLNFRKTAGANSLIYNIGDRIGQLVVVKCEDLEFEEGELSDTKRGSGGFGSSGE